MSYIDETRFRISAKQTSKNFWQLDGTVEYKLDKIKISINPQDTSITITNSLGLQLLSLIKETEKAFRADKRKIIGDED